MESRGRKRVELIDQLPADKRACSSAEFRTGWSSSAVQTQIESVNSASEAPDCEMETTSSSASVSGRSEGEAEKDSSYGSCDSDRLDDSEQIQQGYGGYNHRRFSKGQGKFRRISSSLKEDAAPDRQLAALTELCDVLSFCTEDSMSCFSLETFAPALVRLAKQGNNPDITLLAIRVITYLCDVLPRSSGFLARHEVVPALCAQLMAIEYLDVAEQCLQALEKISRDHPLACLEAGAVMAILSYIDFFSSSTQRVALSTVANICKRLLPDNSASLMDAIPILCNLLQSEDQKIVDNVCLCFVRIAERMTHSSEMLDELCKHGLIHQVVHLITLKSRNTISQPICTDLIGMLRRLATCSLAAVRTLLGLNIGWTLKHILSSYGLSSGLYRPSASDGEFKQVYEVLKLLNELLPPLARNKEEIPLIDGKEKILRDQPELLQQFGVDILPVMIQVFNSGANLYVCYGCLFIIKKLVFFSRSDMLLDLLKNTSISSFLAGAFAHKNQHVLVFVLQIVENILQKLPDAFLDSFIKEGVVYAIDALLTRDKCSWFLFPVSSNVQVSSGSSLKSSVKDICRCLCYTFDNDQLPSSSVVGACLLEQGCVKTLAGRIKATYVTANSHDLEIGLTETLQKLRNLCALLTDKAHMTRNNDSNRHTQQEEELYDILGQIMAELSGREYMSAFEFMESGMVKSLVTYLLNGHLEGNTKQHDSSYILKVLKRLGLFARFAFSTAGHDWRGMPLAILVKKLQIALASLEDLPVIASHISKSSNKFATIPNGRCTSSPSLKIRFVRGKGEKGLCDFAVDVATVEPFASLHAIENFLWPKVCKQRDEHAQETAVQFVTQSMDAQSHKGKDEKFEENHGASSILAEASATEDLARFGADLKTSDSANGSFLSHATPTCCAASASNENIPISNGDDMPKLAFYFDGRSIDRTLTLYQVIVQQKVMAEQDLVVGPRFWNEVYEVTYREGEQTKACIPEKCFDEACASSICSSPTKLWQNIPFSSILVSKLPSDLDKSDPTLEIFCLLKILYDMNRFSCHLLSMDRICAFIMGENKDFRDLVATVPVVPQAEFVNSKLTEKLEQQMRDPLIVSAGSMPSWCSQLMAAFPYLFGFDVRHKYFRLTTFGSSLIHPLSWLQPANNNSHAPNDRQQNTGGLSRKKFQVCRSSILDSATKMMDLYAHQQIVVEVEYDEEVGSGLGPTLEFYTLVSHEFQKVGLGMWRGEHHRKDLMVENSGSLVAPLGLFPCPWSATMSTVNGTQFSEVIKNFVLLGQVVAKALQDGRVLDIHFSKAFYKLILEQELNIYDIHTIDLELGRVLLEFLAVIDKKKFLESVSGTAIICDSCFRNTKIEDLCLDFTLPGYPDYILVPEEEHKMVNLNNLEEYVTLIVDATVHSGVSRQVEAFKSGFNQVFPIRNLQIFNEEELEHMLCGERDALNTDKLLEHIKFDHGYNAHSPPIINLLEIIEEFGSEEKRAFLQFVTGTPRLPPGGLAALNPKLTIVRKHCNELVEGDLPSAMTCANYLKLPPYSSKERMRERLLYAITEGQGSFYLS